MADNDNDSMIGYDPLAWLRDAAEAHQPEADAIPLIFLDEVPALESESPAEMTVDADDLDHAPSAWDDDAQAGAEWANANDFAEPEMAWQDQGGAEVESIVLEAVQTIQNVTALHERFLHLLDGANVIEIDASAITQIDTATLQLLLVLKQTALKMDKQVAIDFPSEKFIEAAQLLGLAEMLDVDQSAAGFF